MARYYDFAGEKIILPGAYTQRFFPDDQGAGAVTGRVIIMGEAARGGIPYDAFEDINDIINIVDGQAQALNVFGGGDLYYGAEFYLTPTKDERFNKPSQAWCIVVNQMTQATTILQASTADIIDIAWNKYGIDANTAAIKVSTGSNTGKLVEAIYKGNKIVDQDDTTLPLMNIQYVGSGTSSTMTINDTTLTTNCLGESATSYNVGTGSGTRNFTGTVLNTPVDTNSVVIEIDGSPIAATDDGAGNITGADVDPGGTNTINYATGAYDFTLLVAPKVGADINITYEVSSTPYDEDVATGDGVVNFTGTLTSIPAIEGSFVVNVDGSPLAITDSGGNFTGADIGAASTINYVTGAYDITFAATPGAGLSIDFDYDYVVSTSENLNITFADYSDMGELINFINNQAAYTCTLTGTSDEKTNVFDAITDQDITTEYECVGIVEAIIRLLNSTESMTASLHSGAARTVVNNLSEYQYFTGGTVSAATTADWIAALEKLEDYDLNNIVCMSGSDTIHSLVEDHVRRMNEVKVKRYRQAGFGAGSTATTKAARIAEMKALNSAYIEYCVSSFTRKDYVNNVDNQTFMPYYLYPLVAGLRYANNVGMDVVFKYLNVLSTPEIVKKDQEDYAAAGATLIQKIINVNNINQFEIKVNNTTYQGSQVTRTNPSVVYEINVLTKDFEEQVIEQIRSLNEVANSVVISKIQSWITTTLFPRYRDDFRWITDGPDGQKAFDNVVFEQEGEQFRTTATLTMSVTPRFAFNFLTFIVPGQNV